jgi:lipoate-protein ligase A
VEWEVIPPSPHPAHMHMALDEVLLESVRAGRRRPTLRLWEWIEPALVIGSHQSVMNEVDAVAARELGFVVTRRMSGGGTMLCEPGRTITYSLYLPESVVQGITFRKSYALLDGWAVRAFGEMGVPASYREINDIISPRGKIAGAAQARRRGFVLHHTTIAHAMDADLLPRLIRIGRPRGPAYAARTNRCRRWPGLRRFPAPRSRETCSGISQTSSARTQARSLLVSSKRPATWSHRSTQRRRGSTAWRDLRNEAC